ncbi:hypothetical protein COR50_21880 [Chitinophaga caeni]|uniref:Uncharacterized protein n=1 Tax=Chitinophaga caeni TaxID=2029983 RepID=A0A291R0C0_9BACT|nr:hypothetical protein [Chitinophaga caeni]ATL49611.1 hypothetical protein COR50_21880 [Chitinophaga caeni]
MKRILAIGILIWLSGTVSAQELYVNSEPASNMPAKALGFRLTDKIFKLSTDGRVATRLEPEIMFGISKNWMVHAQAFYGNAMQVSNRFEGAGVYAKYRFYSSDQPHAHFRMAAYLRASVVDNPFIQQAGEDLNGKNVVNQDLDLEGGVSGVNGGVVATQLIHKLALSSTVGYNRYMNNVNHHLDTELGLPAQAMNYSLSAGYLLLPRKYKSYEQTNLNLYVELLGKSNMGGLANGTYLDIAPAIQFIFNSTTRLDVSYRTELYGNMNRMSPYNNFLIRVEHNIFNALKRKS